MGYCCYHADAEDGEEKEPGQVGAAPVLQRSPFPLCPLERHKNTVTASSESGLCTRLLARLGFNNNILSCVRVLSVSEPSEHRPGNPAVPASS